MFHTSGPVGKASQAYELMPYRHGSSVAESSRAAEERAQAAVSSKRAGVLQTFRKPHGDRAVALENAMRPPRAVAREQRIEKAIFTGLVTGAALFTLLGLYSGIRGLLQPEEAQHCGQPDSPKPCFEHSVVVEAYITLALTLSAVLPLSGAFVGAVTGYVAEKGYTKIRGAPREDAPATLSP